MSFDSLLVHSCTVQRCTSTTVDGYGRPVNTWSNHLPNQACRVGTAKGRTVWNGMQMVLADYIFYFPNIDITEQDRILYEGKYYRIVFVDHTSDSTSVHHHFQVFVEQERPAQ